MTGNVILLLLLLLLNASTIFAQKSTSKKAQKLYESAQKYYQGRNFDKAIGEMQKALQIDPQFAVAHRELGYFYLVLRDTKKSKYHYEQAATLQPKDKNFIVPYIMVAQYHMGEGLYESALLHAKKFLSFNPSLRYKKDIDLAQKIVADCEYAIEGKKQPLDFKPTPLPKEVNAFNQQYFPVLTADQKTLIFTARVSNNDENIYECLWDEQAQKWGEPTYIRELNTHFNEGTCTVSADGKTLIFTACEGSKNRRVVGACDLFISYKAAGIWSAPKNMGQRINSKYWESQPSVSADGRTIYFVSDRPGGYGGNDIWVSSKNENDEWSEPVNVGDKVNSNKDEVSPFIHVNGKTLFFSSDGKVGYGKFDLFQAELEQGKFTKAKNLGYPINDHNAQVSLFITADGATGYYSDEEYVANSVGNSTLTTFTIPEEIRIKEASNFVKGHVYDAKTKAPLQAKINLTDIAANQVISSVESDGKMGDYLIVLTDGSEYALHVNCVGYLYKSLTFDYKLESDKSGVELDVYLDPIEEGSTVTLNNIFFESGSYELLPKSKTELDKLVDFLKFNASMKIEIGGHTDDVGSEQANLQLSMKRAQSVVEYLKEAGIPEERMEFSGYGEAKPIAENSNDENRALNRRIEFKIL